MNDKTLIPKPKPKRQPPLARRKLDKPERGYQIAALDTETNNLDGELLYLQFFHEDGTLLHGQNYEEILEKILETYGHEKQKTRIYIHNLGYDFRYLLDFDIIKNQQLTFRERADGVIYQVAIEGYEGIVFLDSMAIFTASLDRMTAALGGQQKLKYDHSKGFDINDPQAIEYAIADVTSLVDAIQRFDSLVYSHYGVHLRGTISSTALAAYQTVMPEQIKLWQNKPEVDEMSRAAYYGGFCGLNFEPYRHYEHVGCVDVNSMYPASMRGLYPAGWPMHVTSYIDDKPGIYRCTVNLPDIILAGIPSRTPSGAVCYRTGKFIATLTTVEIEYWKTHGATFEVDEGYVYLTTADLFSDFVDNAEKTRAEFADNKAIDTVIKLIQNSLYGKFGTKDIERRELLWSINDRPDGGYNIYVDASGEVIDGLWFRMSESKTHYMHPEIAAFVTANARVNLQKYIDIVGRENVLYTDTDSLHISGTAIENLLDHVQPCVYGKLKIEWCDKTMMYVAPKYYGSVDDDKTLKCKGLQSAIKENNIKNIIDIKIGEQYNYHSSISLFEYIKKGGKAPKFQVRKRAASKPENVKSHELIDGKYRPIKTIGEQK